MIKGKKVLSVVTARGGSKGLAGKNYRELYGVPLTNWSVMASIMCDLVDLTVISSNCPYVKEVVADFTNNQSATYIDRPDELATPLCKNEEALKHAYEFCMDALDFKADVVVNLQPTSPVRHNKLIERCLNSYAEGDYDSLVTVTKHTPLMWQINEDGIPEPNHDIYNRPMRQEIPEQGEGGWWMHDNGNVYLFEVEPFLATNCRIGLKPTLFCTDRWESHQIDDEYDFAILESWAKSGGTIL